MPHLGGTVRPTPETHDLDEDPGLWTPRPTPAPRPAPLPPPQASLRDRIEAALPGRSGSTVRKAVAVLLVAGLSLMSGLLAYEVVKGQRTAAVAPEPASTQSAPPDVAPARPKKLPTTVANGHQLTAAAPLTVVHQDQGSSVQLPDGRTLWIFADTFQLTRDPNFFVTSSAAVTEPAKWRLRYSQNEFSAGKHPVEFLPRTPVEKADSKANDHYQAVWPTGSTRMPDGSILISYAKYRVMLRTKTYEFLGAGLFRYAYENVKDFTAGDHARRIADDIWTPGDGEVRSPVRVEGFVYFTQCEDLRCYALRAPADDVADRGAYVWWTGDGWSDDRADRSPTTVGTNHPGGNPSVVRLSSGVYGMADTEAGSVSTVGRLWVAPKPWGPWSRAASFTMPKCPPPGCYGLNLHPEASTPRSLRVSYATAGERPVVRVDDVPVSYGARGGWITTG